MTELLIVTYYLINKCPEIAQISKNMQLLLMYLYEEHEATRWQGYVRNFNLRVSLSAATD
jgi:hypothetical protein